MDPQNLFAAARAWLRAHNRSAVPTEIVIKYLDTNCKRKATIPLPVVPSPTDAAEPEVQDSGPAEDAEDQPASHSADFRSASRRGQTYSFTAPQATVIRVLWEAHSDGSPDVGQSELLRLAESLNNSGRLRDVFRSRDKVHPAWGTLIVRGETRGTYRLDLG